jgi:hypothetical protein
MAHDDGKSPTGGDFFNSGQGAEADRRLNSQTGDQFALSHSRTVPFPAGSRPRWPASLICGAGVAFDAAPAGRVITVCSYPLLSAG